jgi:hypothetical protein
LQADLCIVAEMGDLKSAKLIYFKGVLFLAGGVLASLFLILDSPHMRTAALLMLAIWCFCRFYYFAFYVIERYVDPQFKFAGLWAMVRYLMRSRRS